MATNDYTEPSLEQMKAVLDEIAMMSRNLKHLCIAGIVNNRSECSFIAASNIAAQIGWMADRCIGFTHQGSDDWLLPAGWENKKSDAHHE